RVTDEVHWRFVYDRDGPPRRRQHSDPAARVRGVRNEAPTPIDEKAQPAADRGSRKTDEAVDDSHPGRRRANAGARTTLAEEMNMRNISEDRRVLRMQFEAFANYA